MCIYVHVYYLKPISAYDGCELVINNTCDTLTKANSSPDVDCRLYRPTCVVYTQKLLSKTRLICSSVLPVNGTLQHCITGQNCSRYSLTFRGSVITARHICGVCVCVCV